MLPRTGVVGAGGVDEYIGSKGVLEMLLDLLDLYPTLGGGAPLMQTYSVAEYGVVNRSEVTHALSMIVGGMGRDPLQYALHSRENRWRHATRGTRGYGCPNTEGG